MKKLLICVIVVLAFIGLLGAYYVINNHISRQLSPSRQSETVTYADKVLSKMSLKDKVASLFILHKAGTDTAALKAFVDRYRPGGMILMGDTTVETAADLRALTKLLRSSDARLPRLVATDQEGGTVRRLSGDDFASALTLKTLPPDATYRAFEARSQLVRSMGITLNFGIVADTTSDPASFIYDRVLEVTASDAAARVRSAVEASKGKTLSTLKHFPGHGETTADSHDSIPTTSITKAEWLARDAPPFRAGIQAGADMVMTGHLRYEAVDTRPASLSKKWHDILRDELSFDGVIITDDMCMLQHSGEPDFDDPVQNAVSALQAGNTMLLYVLDNMGDPATQIDPDKLIDGVVAAVSSGRLNGKLIDANARQVIELRSRTAAFLR